jgi:putative molybdopterin biosynthesis protein
MHESLHQQQFLDVIDRDEAERRFRAVLDLSPLETEIVLLAQTWQRVLAEDIVAPVDVPGFDRANVDGFAVRSEDTFGASEGQPRRLRLNAETLATGIVPRIIVKPGTATPIATGGVLPRGADAVVMIEHTDVQGGELRLARPAAPGANITFAGTDIGQGEMVLRRGELLGSRDTGVLAAIGVNDVPVVRRPRVAILSTGDELVPPGQPLKPGMIHDSNSTVLADAVRELGGESILLGIVPDDFAALEAAVRQALENDVVLLSGGTSKSAGDISYRVIDRLGPPGIVAHGVALKPGKPLCLAAVQLADANRRVVPIAVLPGFPTSAIFTFHEFLAPVIRQLAGRRGPDTATVPARLPMRVNSERGRTEYLLVSLVETSAAGKYGIRNAHGGIEVQSEIRNPKSEIGVSHLVAYPMGKGSGSVTAFSRADGFIVIPRQREFLEAGSEVEVQLLDASLRSADLIVIGSQCIGLDFLLSELQTAGFTSKFLAAGSTGGLEAAKRGECDLTGVHLLDPATNTYNRPFLNDDLLLISGYGRLQGVVFRAGDSRFEGKTIAEAVATALADPNCVLVNRNRGSGTRILIDRLLSAPSPLGGEGWGEGRESATIARLSPPHPHPLSPEVGERGARPHPPGYLTEVRSHNAVVAAVAQGRADWGVAIAPAAASAGLGFIPMKHEQYDFVAPKSRINRPAVQAFMRLLQNPKTQQALRQRGFQLESTS